MKQNSLQDWVLALIFITVSLSALESNEQPEYYQKSRTRRAALLFPPTAPTRTQWIVGIGIPLEDLLFEAMTTGYVLKAEYFLPSTVEQLRTRTTTNIAGRRRRRGTGNGSGHDTGIDDFLYNSSSPLFEAHLVDEAELQHEPFTVNTEKLEELMKKSRKVISNYRWSVYKGLEGLAERLGLPGRSCILKSICEAAEIPFHYKNGMLGELLHIILTPSSSADELSEHADNEYFFAESIGHSGASCKRVFNECNRSLLDHFSNIHLLSKDLSMLLG